ncbi:MAG: hypothetical protein WCK70_01910 [Chloroflexales bacterium]
MTGDQQRDDSAQRPAGFTPNNPPPLSDDIDESGMGRLKAENLLGDQDRTTDGKADSSYQRTQSYAQPFLSMDRSTTGDVVSGSMHKTTIYNYGTTGSQAHPPEVTADQIRSPDKRRVQAIYVQTPSYDRARSILSSRRILILWGDAGCGKATTGLHLLLQHGEEVSRLDPTIDPAVLRTYDFAKSAGALIDTLSIERAQSLTSFTLSSIGSKLLEQQSYLVLTIDRHVPIDRTALGDYLILWEERPPCVDMLHKHLEWLIPADDADARQRAIALTESEAILEFLKTKPSLRAASELAILLRRVIDGDLSFDIAMQQVSSFAYAQVQDWFQQPDRSLAERSLMITLGVFSGARQQIIKDAESALLERLRPPGNDDKPAEAERDLFASSSDQLRKVCAHQERAIEETNVGSTEVITISFDNPTFQTAVLDYVWIEYNTLRDSLLDWLYDLGRHPDEAVRGRAAAATGWLARHDITAVVNSTVARWSGDAYWQARDSAALALGVLANDDRLTPNVMALLKNWSVSGANVYAKMSASAAYGGLVGSRYPSVALQQLSMITHTNRVDMRLIQQVIRSTFTLFQQRPDDPEHALKVLETLRIWTESPGLQLSIYTGLMAFLRIAQESRVRAVPPEGWWPTLLTLADKHHELRKPLVILWRRAITNRLTSRHALRVSLRRWLRAVDKDKRIEQPFERLVKALMKGEDDDYRRIESWLEDRVEEIQSETAKKLLIMLGQ